MKKDEINQLFGLIGPAGAGKTEISRHLRQKHGFFYIPSVTTRPPRKGNLKEYKHIEIEVFESHIKNNELLEYTVFAGHYYGKLKKDVKEHLEKGHSIYTLTPDKVEKLKKEYMHTKIICVLPEDPILKTVKKRLKDRNHTEEEIKKRLETAEKELILIEELKNNGLIDHFVKTLESDYQHAFREMDKIVEKYLA